VFDVLVDAARIGATWIAYRDSRKMPEPVAVIPVKKATKRPAKK